MYNGYLKIFYQTLFFILIVSSAPSFAKEGKNVKNTTQVEDDVVFTAEPEKKEAIFESHEKIVYNVNVRNNLGEEQAGKVGYVLLDLQDKVIKQDGIDVKVGKKTDKNFTLKIPAQSPGFYKVQLTINVTDYDDTIRRVVGVDPKKIKSETSKPGDFDQFWQNARDTLAMIPMEAKVIPQPALDRDNSNCYLVELKSYEHYTIRGWLTLPKDRTKREKLPVWFILPGYGPRGVKPIYGDDLAIFCLNVRGVGNSKDKINPTEEGYVTTNIENRYKYIYRGVIMDCLRGLDFIASRPDFDLNNILCSGASMGGYLAIATSSLDKRVKLCSANNPVFSDYRSLMGSKEWPMKSFVKYTSQKRIPLSRVMNNLDYYDLKNFAPNMKCKSLVGIGLLDNLAPPYNQYVMINSLTNKNKLFVYPNLAHEVPEQIYKYLSNWMMDEFGMF
ncbi:acetylxylan esterase [Mucilaginibacter sp. RS28]|uniref:Acetylxylan esterase n=1 Tax=Mucilaginibacter straminoryzae TaxID=2932774 RepID=A0A9X2BAY8_9SPHI|nr:acetylxylan esterase [Mucilaginibacter straminoryzae]MCJ8211891.1 acetylxylan esterase [Mucilaginibacter straminoryzae]